MRNGWRKASSSLPNILSFIPACISDTFKRTKRRRLKVSGKHRKISNVVQLSGSKAVSSHDDLQTSTSVSSSASIIDDIPMTSKQTAEFVHCSEKTLERDRLRGGGIPFIRFGKRVIYLKSDVIAWLQQHRVTSTSAKS